MSVGVGRNSLTGYSFDMYNNDAATTMLDYLSSSSLRFLTYTYDEEQCFAGQSVRGSYSRNDEVTVTNVYASELYLFSGGQLQLYFQDMAGANIRAMPIGYCADAENLSQAG